MAQVVPQQDEADTIVNTYKKMTSDCQQIASKISELNMEKDEHRLVVETLSKLEGSRKAFRLIGGILVERTVEEVLPAVQEHFEGVSGAFVLVAHFLIFFWVKFNIHFDYNIPDQGIACKAGRDVATERQRA